MLSEECTIMWFPLFPPQCNMQEGLEGNPVAKTMKTYSRILAIIAIPVMMSFPKVSEFSEFNVHGGNRVCSELQNPLFHCLKPFQALFCYWLTSNVFSLAYGLGEFSWKSGALIGMSVFETTLWIEARDLFALMRCSNVAYSLNIHGFLGCTLPDP